MSDIVVERPGMQSLIVDRGRFGYRSSGVAWCGAMDLLALSVANLLCGNGAGDAALEIAFGGAALRFVQPAIFALAGADCSASLDGVALAPWGRYAAAAGSLLELRRPRRGTRTVLAVRGGFDVPVVLGSRSTDLTAGMGGFAGRALAAGDRLAIGARTRPGSERPLRVKPPQWDFARAEFEAEVMPIRALALAQDETFWEEPWRVSPASSRMGYRLSGAYLRRENAKHERSHAVFPGIVQLPPSGEPIALLADAHTTGGYAKIAVVIEADLWKVAQLQPDNALRFVPVTAESAQEATAQIERYVQAIAALVEKAAS